MAYRVTVLSVSTPIPVGTNPSHSYAPWGGYKGNPVITFQNPQLGTVTIDDDDGLFEPLYYVPEDRQTVVETVTVGNLTLEAGTRLTSHIGTLIQDPDGNQYFAVFPRTAEHGSFGTELGDRTTVLIFPYSNGDTPHQVPFDPGKTYSFQDVRSTQPQVTIPYPQQGAPCFTTGTLIQTRLGPRRIEALSPGDMILTRDNGMRRLVWIGRTRLDRHWLDLQPNLRPIRIRAGALAPGIPARDLTVSPQHRILVRSNIAANMFGEIEILVAAKHLTGLPGIEVIDPPEGVTYWHMLFDGHEVVQSNGAWTESLFTGPQAMESVGEAARREILTLFPQLAAPDFTPRSARRLLTGREGRKLAERHIRHARSLVQENA